MSLFKNLSNIENIILAFISILFPWSIMFATSQLHIGYWGQVEGMIIFNHFTTAIIALFLVRICVIKKELRKIGELPWCDGVWDLSENLQLPWDRVENTRADINTISNYIIRRYQNN